MAELMSIPEFSVHLGYGRTYGYQLRKEGRLVMTEDGKHVRVRESEERVRATADPAKTPVAQRHAATRGAAPESLEADPLADPEPPGYDFQSAKAKREHWAAERELAQFRKEAGELIDVSEHVAAFARAGASLRAGLEAWAAMLPPQLVGRDEGAIRAVIADQVEGLLRELSTQIGAMAAHPGSVAA